MSQLPDIIMYLIDFIISDAPITYHALTIHNNNTFWNVLNITEPSSYGCTDHMSCSYGTQ